MTFHPTVDVGLIQTILTHPAVWGLMANDSAPSREGFRVERGNYRAILCRKDDGMLAGLFLLCPTGAPTSAEVHFCFLPHARRRIIQAGREFVAWCWRETSMIELFGAAPTYNRTAFRLAKACGFEELTRQSGAGTKDGKPFDLIVMRIARTA